MLFQQNLDLVNRIFDNPSLYSGVENLLGAYGYAMQIYCDFSGYSDMAIGIALLLGFRFPLNFNAPYRSASLTEFWRRWHISLSSWIRDYIYIPLGGNRKGKARQYLNLFITWILCGLWHGASLNFVFWGLLHGVGLLVNKFFSEVVMRRDKRYESHGWQRVAGVVLTFHFVCLAWMFFRNSSFDTTFTQLGIIFTRFHGELTWGVITGYGAVMLLMLIGYLTHFVPERWENGARGMLQQAPVWYCAFLLTVVIYIVIQVKSSDIQPFIYFQF